MIANIDEAALNILTELLDELKVLKKYQRITNDVYVSDISIKITELNKVLTESR